MSLQDDHFEVADKLKGTPEAEQFERIWEAFCEHKSALEVLSRHNRTVSDLVEIVMGYWLERSKE